MTDPTSEKFDVDALKRALADAIRRSDERTAASIKADLARLSDTRETAVNPPPEVS